MDYGSQNLEKIYSIYESYLEKKQYNKAEIALLEYIKLADENNVIGNYYYRLDNLKNLKVIHTLSEKDREYEKKLSYSYKICMRNNKYNDGLKIANKYYGLLKGKTVISNLFMAKANTLLENYDEAKKYIDKAFELNDLSPFCYVELIRYNIWTGEYEEALKNIESFKKIDKKIYHSSFLFLFEIYYLNGNKEKAKNILNEGYSTLDKFQKKELKTKSSYFVKMADQNIKNPDKALEQYMKDVLILLTPDKDNIVKPLVVIKYINNLDLDPNFLSLVKLNVAKLLEQNKYSDYANIFINDVEHEKNKSSEVKKQLILVRNDIKLLRNIKN